MDNTPFPGRYSVSDMIHIAAAIWDNIRTSLESILIVNQERFHSARLDENDREDEDDSSACIVSCKIFFVNLPIILLSYRHLLCKYCLNRLIKCPFCREPILKRIVIFL